MNELRIADLFDEKYPHASFLNARITNINLDYVKKEARFDCGLYIGNPDDEWKEDAIAKGQLLLSGLLYCAIAPPDENYSYDDGKGLDIADDGSVTSIEYYQPQIATLPKDMPEDAFVHYFYATNCNSLMFVAATGVSFQWT